LGPAIDRRICGEDLQQLDHFVVYLYVWVSEFVDRMALGDAAELHQGPDPVAAAQAGQISRRYAPFGFA
jgi:hypothetical protein